MRKLIINCFIATTCLWAGISAPASAFFHNALFGNDKAAEEAPQAAAASDTTQSSGIPVVRAGEAGLVDSTSDGGLGTGIYPWDLIMGDPNAPVTITEYASMTCGHCANFHNNTYPQMMSELVASGKVKFIYRDYPLDGVAFRLASVGRCLPTAEAAKEYTTYVYAEQKTWIADPDKDYYKLPYAKAQELGLDQAAIDACLADETITANMNRMRLEGQGLGVRSTPSIFVNNTLLRGAQNIGELRAAVNAAQ